jgi:hypothetical protein
MKLKVNVLSVRCAGSHSLGKIIQRFGGKCHSFYHLLLLTFMGILYNHAFFHPSSFAEARLLVSSSLLRSAFRKAKESPDVLGVRKKEPNHPMVA